MQQIPGTIPGNVIIPSRPQLHAHISWVQIRTQAERAGVKMEARQGQDVCAAVRLGSRQLARTGTPFQIVLCTPSNLGAGV
jgi:hypothetical protein